MHAPAWRPSLNISSFHDEFKSTILRSTKYFRVGIRFGIWGTRFQGATIGLKSNFFYFPFPCPPTRFRQKEDPLAAVDRPTLEAALSQGKPALGQTPRG
jgi:hypothetical protein